MMIKRQLKAIRVKAVSKELMDAIASKDFERDEPEYNNNTPIFEGLDTNQPEVVHHLLDSGADPNIRHKKDLATPLIRVCSQPHKPSYPTTKFSRDVEDIRHNLTKALLGKNADVNLSDKEKNTALFAALQNSKLL